MGLMKYGRTMNLMKYLYKHTPLIKSLEILVCIIEENMIRCCHSSGWDVDTDWWTETNNYQIIVTMTGDMIIVKYYKLSTSNMIHWTMVLSPISIQVTKGFGKC